MNHYERLKVTRDAPPEVIRAAYRALAQALPDDVSREAHLLALNEAYETLNDPETRQAYDTVLLVGVADIEIEPVADSREQPHVLAQNLDVALDLLHQSEGAEGVAQASIQPSDDDQVDPWQAVYDAPSEDTSRSWTQQPVLWFGGGLLLLMAAGVAVLGWQQYRTSHLTQDLAAQVGRIDPDAIPPVVKESASIEPRPDKAVPMPSLEELSRMSDEELLEVLPALDGKKPTGDRVPARSPAELDAPRLNARSGAASRHPLDGAPLKLQTESDLVDPLAPELSPRSASNGR